LLDQVVDAVRARLVDPATTDAAALTAVARRLVAIDPDRAGIGGLRLQLELALFGGGSTATSMAAPTPTTASTAAVEPAPPRPAPAPVVVDTDRQAATAPESPSAPSPTESQPPPMPVMTPPTPKPPRTSVASAEGPPPGSPARQERAAVAVASDEPPPAPAPVTVGVGADLDRLVAEWAEIVRAVRPATRAVLTECRPIAVDGNVVTLGFPEAKAFLKDHAERRRQEVEAAVGAHLGRDVSVRSVATNIEVAPLVAADDLVAEAKRIFGEDLVEVAEID
jgi:hypothetical protein